jgi:hypothetical protein
MIPTPAHIQARKALAADLAARHAFREEAQAVAAYLARAAYIPAAPRPPLGPLALAALARIDPAPRETMKGLPQ